MGLLPELNDDATTEILLRIAPDEPACLFRALVICKLWHRIISDTDFSRRYRAIHDAPLLGFFYNLDFPETNSGIDFPAAFSRFVPTTAASPLPHAAATATHGDYCHVSRALDCRYGRVLFEKADSTGFAVWDPIRNYWTDLPLPGINYNSYSAVVLCDVAGCDHSDCHGGRFHVVCIGSVKNLTVYACVYSSGDRAWQAPVSGSSRCWRFYLKRPTVLKDGIYCTGRGNHDWILKYNLVERRFSWIDMPSYSYRRETMLMQNEDGSLGLAGVRGSTLDLWSIRSNKPTGGNARCGQWKQVIKHRKILRVDNKQCLEPNLIGFAEGVGVFVIRTNDGVFMLKLKSRRVMKVSDPSNNCPSIVPFMSFFTPAGRAS